MNAIPIAVATTAVNLCLVVGGLTGFRSTSAQQDAPLLRGRALELVDDRGQIRARLDVESGGEVVLRLLDRRGTIRVKLGAGDDGSGLLLNNDATEPGVHTGRATPCIRAFETEETDG